MNADGVCRLEAQGRTHFIDFSDSQLYVGPCFLYIFYGMYDAFWQGYTYWLLGSLCNTPKEAARFVAVYKTMQVSTVSSRQVLLQSLTTCS